MVANQLSINLPIVTTKGTPTGQFMQQWNQIVRASSTITAAQISAALDTLGNAEGDMLRRGPSGWLAITSPGGTTRFLRADGSWQVPAGGGGGSLAALSDVSIPSPNNGEVLTYDNITTKWESKPVGGVTQSPFALKWRARTGTTANGNSNTGWAIMEMHAVPTGPQLCVTTSLLTVDTTSFGNKDWLITGTAAVGQFWVAPTGASHWAEYDFPTPVSINEFQFVMVQDGAGSGPGCWPQDIFFEYWNGSVWITEWSVHGQHPSPNTLTPVVYTNPAYALGITLRSLADVNIPSPSDGDFLSYDARAAKWENVPSPAGPVFGTPASTKWRLDVFTTPSNPHFALTQVQMRAAPGGTNLSTDHTHGSVSGSFSGYNQDTLWDGSASWVSSSLPGWIEYDFTVATSINEITLTGYVGGGNGPGAFPLSWTVSYWNGSAWVVAWTETGTTILADGEVKSFDYAGYGHDALKNLTDVNIPTPSIGQVLTFNGSKWDAESPAGGAPLNGTILASKWRLYIESVFSHPEAALIQIQMKSQPGGANLSTNALLGSVSSTFSGYNQATLWDGSANFVWSTSANEWAEYDFAAPVSINEVVLTAFIGAGDGVLAFPFNWRMDYWDGAAWQPAWREQATKITADGQTVTYDYFPLSGGVNVRTETANYTLLASDANAYIRMDLAGANTLTIPDDTTILPIGTVVRGFQLGAGQTTLVPAGGVTLNARAPPGTPFAQHEGFTLIKAGPNEWDAHGEYNI